MTATKNCPARERTERGENQSDPHYTANLPQNAVTVNGYIPGFLPFNGLAPAAKASPTSCEAARRIQGGANRLRARVLQWFIDQGQYGGTDEEAQAALGMKTQSETPRRRELVLLGLLVDSGRRRPTTSGRPATVRVTATATAGGGADA